MVLGSSIAGTTNVFCDGGNCHNWTPGVIGARGMARAARAQAKANGWTYVRRGGVYGQMVDLCPECSANAAEDAKKAAPGDTE